VVLALLDFQFNFNFTFVLVLMEHVQITRPVSEDAFLQTAATGSTERMNDRPQREQDHSVRPSFCYKPTSRRDTIKLRFPVPSDYDIYALPLKWLQSLNDEWVRVGVVM
jgi:hypothetical protein